MPKLQKKIVYQDKISHSLFTWKIEQSILLKSLAINKKHPTIGIRI